MTSSNSPDFDFRACKRAGRDGYNLIAQRHADAAGLRGAVAREPAPRRDMAGFRLGDTVPIANAVRA